MSFQDEVDAATLARIGPRFTALVTNSNGGELPGSVLIDRLRILASAIATDVPSNPDDIQLLHAGLQFAINDLGAQMTASGLEPIGLTVVRQRPTHGLHVVRDDGGN